MPNTKQELIKYIEQLKQLISIKLSAESFETGDLTLRDKHCLVREIYTDLEKLV